MNRIDFQQAGGFPLEVDTLDFVQAAYTSLQAISSLGGDNYILSGCIVSGSNVTDGFIVINGEVLIFKGGLSQTNIVIREEKQTRPFENGQVKDVFITRYATFGTGLGAIAFATLNRLKPLTLFKNLPHQSSNSIDLDDDNVLATSKAVKLLNDKINQVYPPGAIVIWSGAINAIPGGWALCNGQNGTPNLTDKFVLGAGFSYPVGAVGGAAQHQLTVDEMPSHSHTLGTTNSDNGAGAFDDGTPGGGQRATSTVGGNLPHNNMPPYYALAYIIKINQ